MFTSFGSLQNIFISLFGFDPSMFAIYASAYVCVCVFTAGLSNANQHSNAHQQSKCTSTIKQSKCLQDQNQHHHLHFCLSTISKSDKHVVSELASSIAQNSHETFEVFEIFKIFEIFEIFGNRLEMGGRVILLVWCIETQCLTFEKHRQKHWARCFSKPHEAFSDFHSGKLFMPCS